MKAYFWTDLWQKNSTLNAYFLTFNGKNSHTKLRKCLYWNLMQYNKVHMQALHGYISIIVVRDSSAVGRQRNLRLVLMIPQSSFKVFQWHSIHIYFFLHSKTLVQSKTIVLWYIVFFFRLSVNHQHLMIIYYIISDMRKFIAYNIYSQRRVIKNIYIFIVVF